jgi:hypothetical protein
MGLAQTIVAALGILLWGIAPAAAGADGGGGGNAVSEQSGSKGAVPEQGPVSDLLNAKDRLDPVASGPAARCARHGREAAQAGARVRAEAGVPSARPA